VRVVFFGSPPFATPILAALIRSPFRPVAVATQPERDAGRGRKPAPSAVADRAAQAGIPVVRPTSARDAAFKHSLAQFEPDVLVVASYGELLDDELLAIAPRGALNVHGSLLPRWRGASPVQAAILAGDLETGVAVQRMVRKLDAGDVLLERTTPIGADETAGELAERLADLGALAIEDALARVAAGTAVFTPQDESRVTHCRKIPKAAGTIDWHVDAASLVRHVRAYSPWPGARAVLLDGRELVLAEVVEAAGVGALEPGAIDPTSLRDGRLVVAAGTGAVEVLRVQPAGKRLLPAAEWLRGARLGEDAVFATAPTSSKD